jgi:phosphoribosylformylglycinamidine synthase
MAHYRVTVKVTLRKSILDPQGNATQHALVSLGFEGIESVRIGKHVELVIEAAGEAQAREVAHSAAAKLLANPVMDDFEITEVREEPVEAAGT